MEIEFYRDEAGTSPVKNFLDTQDIRMRQKMMRSIQALQEMGTSLRMPLSESLEDGIFELRAQVGGNVGNKAVLTHGFTKKTQKTPRREIAKAQAIREKYRKQQKGGANNG